MNHRAAIAAQHQQQRIRTASEPDAIRLAEVESAVIASKTELENEEQKMRDDGKYSDAYIVKHMADRKVKSLAYIAKLRTDIVDPIAKKIESQAQDMVVKIPERSAVHIEASQHYAALDSDRRQEAISRAVTGKDDVLAVALLTGRDPITDITREHLMKRLAPGDSSQREQIMNMAERVQGTINTIGELR